MDSTANVHAIADMEKVASMPLNQDTDPQRVSGTNMMRHRPAPLQQPGASFTGRGLHGKGAPSPLGKSAEGLVSPFARSQVQSPNVLSPRLILLWFACPLLHAMPVEHSVHGSVLLFEIEFWFS